MQLESVLLTVQDPISVGGDIMSEINNLQNKLNSLNLSLNEISAKDITRIQQALTSINNSIGAKYITQNDTSDIITCQSNCCQSNCCQRNCMRYWRED